MEAALQNERLEAGWQLHGQSLQPARRGKGVERCTKSIDATAYDMCCSTSGQVTDFVERGAACPCAASRNRKPTVGGAPSLEQVFAAGAPFL